MKRTPSREQGALMIEMALALSIFAVGVLAYMNSFFSSTSAFGSVEEIDEITLAFENMAEHLREETFDDVYAKYNGASPMTLYQMKGPSGGPAVVTTTCFVNETNVPAEFGPISDLDGNASQQSTDVSGSYLLLPVRMRVTFQTGQGTQVRDQYIILEGPDV